MQRIGMPLLVHGEVADHSVDIFDREQVFIERILLPLLKDFPALKVVLEHITTAEAADVVREGGARLGATIRSEEHTSELQSLMRISYAVFCLKKKTNIQTDK